MSSIRFSICLAILTITNAALIAFDSMENCNAGEAEKWISIVSGYVSKCYASTNCLSSSNICTSIRQHSLIYKTFSITNYSSIYINYDVNIGADSTLEDYNSDYIYIFYSCKVNINLKLAEYTGKESFYNETFSLSSDCDNSNELILYFLALTSATNQDESADISDLYIYGNYDTEAIIPSNTTNIAIGHDSMEDYTINWIKDMGTVTSIQSSSSEAAFCVIPPCTKFLMDSQITLIPNVTTVGYKNIKIIYELYADKNFESGDKFTIYYDCIGSGSSLIELKSYGDTADGVPFIGDVTNFPSTCDNITNLKLSMALIGSGSEFVTIRNINILGDLIVPTIAPTYNPTFNPTTIAPTSLPTTIAPTTAVPTSLPTTITPTTMTPTTNSPTTELPTTIFPTVAPSLQPTIAPSESEYKLTVNSKPTVNPTKPNEGEIQTTMISSTLSISVNNSSDESVDAFWIVMPIVLVLIVVISVLVLLSYKAYKKQKHIIINKDDKNDIKPVNPMLDYPGIELRKSLDKRIDIGMVGDNINHDQLQVGEGEHSFDPNATGSIQDTNSNPNAIPLPHQFTTPGAAAVDADNPPIPVPPMILRLSTVDNINNEEEKEEILILNDNNDDIQGWLATVCRLPQYYQMFMLKGYNSFNMIKTIESKSTLNDIGVDLKGHQTKIWAQIKKLKEKDNIIFKQNSYNNQKTKGVDDININIDNKNGDITDTPTDETDENAETIENHNDDAGTPYR